MITKTENGKEYFRVGTAAPFGWELNTFNNRVARKHGYHDYNKSLAYILWRIFCLHTIWRPWNRFIYRVWWPLRCRFNFHQKDMFSLDPGMTMRPWCYWCKEQIGDSFDVGGMESTEFYEKYEAIINACYMKKKTYEKQTGN